MKTQILLLTGTIILLSCAKKDYDTQPLPDADNRVNLASLAVGQHSIYLHFSGECSMDNAAFTSDSMRLEVLQGENGFIFKESFTAGSPNFGGIDPIEYAVYEEGDYILIPERFNSRLFFFYGNDSIWKNPLVEVELNKVGCLMYHPNGELFVGDEIGHIDHLDLGMETKNDLLVISCVPFFTMDAYIGYTPAGFEVSYIQTGPMDQPMIEGWARVE